MSEAQPTTIFDKILAGEVTCHEVYQDGSVLAFLDINPISPGHTLVIPKERAAQIHELSADSAAALGRTLPRICRAILRATGATAYNILQNNGAPAHQAVMHVHFHIIPKSGAKGFAFEWNAGRLDDSEGRRLAAAIASELQHP